jgi:hypothetical protein
MAATPSRLHSSWKRCCDIYCDVYCDVYATRTSGIVSTAYTQPIHSYTYLSHKAHMSSSVAPYVTAAAMRPAMQPLEG